jgi:hypothetical protein
MSLEKEPAGAFNKAQRLNEQHQRIPHRRQLQGLAGFNAPWASAEQFGLCEFRLERRLRQGELRVRNRDLVPITVLARERRRDVGLSSAHPYTTSKLLSEEPHHSPSSQSTAGNERLPSASAALR